jgi:hypothetical protein
MEDRMKNNKLVSRLALAAAVSLSAASLVAMAGEAVDTTEIEVVANGKTEKFSIDNLKQGETRQLYSEAGTLVTATRLADSLQLDIGGEKTTVPMVEAGELSDEELLALVEAGGGTADGKHVIRIHHGEGDKAGGMHRKVIVLDGKEGGAHALDGHEPHVIVKDGGDGKQVIVKRRIVKADATTDAGRK